VRRMQPVIKPIRIGDNPTGVEERKAVVDLHDNRLLAIVSNRYKLIKHQSVINACEQAFKTVDDLKNYNIHALSYRNEGARLIQLYNFPEVEYEVDGQSVNLEMRVTNSYDLTYGVNVDLLGYRLQCKNDLFTGKPLYSLHAKHTTNFDPEVIFKTVPSALLMFKKQVEEWEKWTEVELESDKIIDNVFEAAKYRELARRKLKVYSGKLTLWVMFMLITNIMTHEMIDEHQAMRHESKVMREFSAKFEGPTV